MPLVVEMPGRCPKCGGRLMKRTGKSKKNGRQFIYYCCEHLNSKDEKARCDFMTWDVPVKDDCPLCGHTLFKKAGRGARKPFCINPACENFLPEEKRGYPRPAAKKDGDAENPEAVSAETAETAAAAKASAAKKPAAKKTAAKPSAAKKTAAKKTAAKKTAASKSAGKASKAKKETEEEA